MRKGSSVVAFLGGFNHSRRGSIAAAIEKISCGEIEYDVDGNIALDVKETRT